MRTMTRVYDTYSSARRAVEELEGSGVPSSDISLVANKHVSAKYENVDETSAAADGAGIGAALGGGAGLLTGLGIMAIPGLGPVVAAGWLASTLVGAAAGAATGGLIGALVDTGVSENDAEVYAESVRRGGTLLTVRVPEGAVPRVTEIVDRYGPIDAVTRRREYTDAGWTRFDDKAAPYRPTEAEIERMRRQS